MKETTLLEDILIIISLITSAVNYFFGDMITATYFLVLAIWIRVN